MDHSWRPRPSIQGNNICPTCSISHFPFCHPHPHPHPFPLSPFNQNPQFQSHHDHFLSRPPFDPYLDRNVPATNIHRPFLQNPNQEFGDQPHWNTNPTLDRDPYRDGSSYDQGGVGFKRMRVDENHVNSWEVERRLKLIRDHGTLPSAPPDFNPETKGYMPMNLQQDSFLGFSNNRTGTSSRLDPDFNLTNYEEEQRYMFGNKREEFEDQSRYSLHNNGHGPDEEAALYNGGRGNLYNSNAFSGRGDLEQPPFASQRARYDNFDAPSENYRNYDFQRIHPSDSLSVKEPLYSDYISGLTAPYHEQRSSFTRDDRTSNNYLPDGYSIEHRMNPNQDFRSLGQLGDTRQSVRVNDLSHDSFQDYSPIPLSQNVGPRQDSRVFNVPPPLPASPPPPIPLAPSGRRFNEPHALSSPPKAPSSLFPIPVGSSADVPASHPPDPESYSLTQAYYTGKLHTHASTGFADEEFQAPQASSKKYLGDNQSFAPRRLPSGKAKVVDASNLFKHPHRATRPDRIVIILRGLPGSGKSYLAKMLRDLEVENGGNAPRIHSMDDYFMTEVEKFEESEVSKSSGSVRGKKPVMKVVMEYCYEPEMEEAYRSSMLKAFKKTLDEGVFSFIIVDDRNLRVADFAQFWATAKRSGYEVYLLEAAYKDPTGCAARNVHGFSQDDIQKMAGQWEEASSLYLKLDIKSLVHGDDLEESGIQEVDMDTEDGEPSDGLSGSENRNLENVTVPLIENPAINDPSKDDRRWYAEKGHPTEEVKELKRSKWSDDLDEDDAKRTQDIRGNSSALSGLIQAYSKEGKSVRWGDQGGKTGFSIGAAKRENVLSLVIGPGSGYNSKSNPLPVEENMIPARESKRQNMFQEQLRAEHESFKAVFDKRRHRIGGLSGEDD